MTHASAHETVPPFGFPWQPFSVENPTSVEPRLEDALLDAILAEPEASRRLAMPSGHPLTFGLEIEFTVTKNPNVVLDYRPFDVDDGDWISRPWQERIAFLVEWKRRMFPEARQRPIFLERISGRSSALPERLTMEPNGVFEMRSPVFVTLSDAGRFLRAVQRACGPAQYQGHVVFAPVPLPGLTGYTVFEADRAMLVNLADDWAEFLENGREPAAHFVSAFLSPLNHESVRLVAQGERDLEAGCPAPCAPKFLYSPALRHGIYGDSGLVGIEVRQWDFPTMGQHPLSRRAGLLVQSMALTAFSLSSGEGLTPFARFAFAPLAKWDVALQELSSVVRDAECRGRCPGIEDAAEWARLFELAGSAVAERNGKSCKHDPRLPFLQPFRAWGKHPFFDVLEGSQRFGTEILVRRATREYAMALWEMRELRGAELLKGFRRKVAQWAHDSQLGELARRWGRISSP